MRSDLTWNSIWGKGDPITVEAFERKTGYKLPIAYKTIVSNYEGASPDPNKFKFYSNLENDEVIYDVGIFLPYSSNPEREPTMEEVWKTPPEGFPQGLLAFSVFGNGDLICFDYRKDPKTDDPPIVVWHHEGGWGTEKQVSFVANNFKDFLDMLY
ncbi:MAG: SMI1/KNR4 family protein [Candidatus Hadarchaeum sp.]